MECSRRSVLAFIVVGVVGSISGPAMAQGVPANFPNKPIRLVVGYAPGSPVDNFARRLATVWAEKLNGVIVVENRPGAAGTLGAAEVARAAGDGYTLLMTVPDPMVGATALVKSLPYDPGKDFRFISKVTNSGSLLAINASYKINNLKELIVEAKARQGAMTYGSFGPGSSPNLNLETFAKETGVKFTEVRYRGSPQAVQDVVGGQVAMTMTGTMVFAPMIAAGKLVPLAITGQRRNPMLPHVPTFKELGFDHFILGMSTWTGIVAPASLPAPLAERLSETLRAAVRSPEVEKFLTGAGAEVVASTPAEFERQYREELAVVPRVMRDDLKLMPE